VTAHLFAGYDFAYTWPWTYGHLIVALALAGAGRLGRNKLGRWISLALYGAAAWAFAGFLIVQLVFGYNSPQRMPTDRFMLGARGEVLDIGCGSGRTTIMVGLARPWVRIAALDNFSAQYIRNNGEDLLRQNLRVAGIEDGRVRVLRADMRHIPAKDGEFDGVVSSYAIDHLNRKGIEQTLAEVARVLKPEGEFLLMVISSDAWLKVVYGPMLMHMRGVWPDYWQGSLEKVRLRVVEQGRTPGSAYFLCRKLP